MKKPSSLVDDTSWLIQLVRLVNERESSARASDVGDVRTTTENAMASTGMRMPISTTTIRTSGSVKPASVVRGLDRIVLFRGWLHRPGQL